jgi:hypothetical protein
MSNPLSPDLQTINLIAERNYFIFPTGKSIDLAKASSKKRDLAGHLAWHFFFFFFVLPSRFFKDD